MMKQSLPSLQMNHPTLVVKSVQKAKNKKGPTKIEITVAGMINCNYAAVEL
jgi:hypothetical protein